MAHSTYYDWGYDDGVAMAGYDVSEATRLRQPYTLTQAEADANRMWHHQFRLTDAEMTEYLTGVSVGYSLKMQDLAGNPSFIDLQEVPS